MMRGHETLVLVKFCSDHLDDCQDLVARGICVGNQRESCQKTCKLCTDTEIVWGERPTSAVRTPGTAEIMASGDTAMDVSYRESVDTSNGSQCFVGNDVDDTKASPQTCESL